MRAESYVYQDEAGKGHVGRKLPAGMQASRIANPGDEVPDAVVKKLGLKDLKDRNKYDEKQTYDYPKEGPDGTVIHRPS